ncbi:MAG: DNA polymerase I [Candidatus Nanopelagicales bacterium]
MAQQREPDSRTDQAPRLLLLDGHSLAYRAFYALPVENFSTSTGQATNAVYGFTSMLINALRDEKPTHVAVAFDVSRKTFRSDIYADYKANRKASPEGFAGQVDLIRQVLTAMGVPFAQIDGVEADDILATWATKAAVEGADVSIITGDRDAFQLVDEHVTVLYPRKGMSDLARMTPAAVAAKYGLTPAQYPDFAALRGDPSDNLPGIPGVGEKTATKWISAYGSLEGVVSNADKITGKVGDALREHLPQVLVNRQLTQLMRDVEVPVSPLNVPIGPVDVAAVDAVFDALEFRALRERFLGAVDLAEVDAAAPADWMPVAAGGVVDALALLPSEPVTVAVAGSWGSGAGELIRVAIATDESVAQVVELNGLTDGDRDALWVWLADETRPKVMFDAKGPLLAALSEGHDIKGVVFDVALAAYLLSPGSRVNGLAGITEKILNRTLAAAAVEPAQMSLSVTGDEDQGALAQEAAAIRDLAHAMKPMLEERSLLALLTEIELPTSRVLAAMELTGIAVDREKLEQLSDEFDAQAAQAEQAAHDIVGQTFNLGSPKQLQGVLFDLRGLPKTKKIKTGFTTDADALNALYEKTHDPVLEQILSWRDATKLRQTVDGLIPIIDANGRIHTTFQQTIAATGRLSSTDPNLQNIPIRTEQGRRIRDCFVVGEGFESLLTADYSQIEMRIMAHLCGDEALRDAFAQGEDLHTTVAASVFEVAPTDVDAEMRRRIKAMSYGLAYGLSAYGLSQQLGIGVDEAKVLMGEYFARFGGVRDYLSDVVDQARRVGYTETMHGRRRYLPDLTSDNRQRRDMAERMALNAPIQGTAADIMKVAMIDVERALAQRQLHSRLLLQVHDELIIEVAPGEVDQVRTLVVQGMEAAADLSVPLEVSVGIGRSWESAGH